MGNCAGVDWASEKHDVRVCNAAGDQLLATTFAHNEAGLRSLCGVLVQMKVELVAVERPDGVLVDRLLDAGLRVLALHPNQVAAARARFRASGGKSDQFDAFVICELARTDSDQTKALKALTRAREDFVTARVALVNQLRAELERFWPGPAGLFSSLDCLISLAFLRRYPSPVDAQRLTAARLLATLETLGKQEKQLDREIASAIRAHPDGEIFLSLFKGADTVLTASVMLAEIGDCRARYPTHESLSGDAGQSPVAVESGKHKVAHFRWACNKRLRDAFCTLADSARHWHPWAQAVYARAIARGHDHQRAIRTLGRAWSRIVWRCWQERVPYELARHCAAQQYITVTIPTPSGDRVDVPATQPMAGDAPGPQPGRRWL